MSGLQASGTQDSETSLDKLRARIESAKAAREAAPQGGAKPKDLVSSAYPKANVAKEGSLQEGAKPKDPVTSITAKAKAAIVAVPQEEDKPKDPLASIYAKIKAAKEPVPQEQAKTKDAVTSTGAKASKSKESVLQEGAKPKDAITSLYSKAKATTEAVPQAQAKSNGRATSMSSKARPAAELVSQGNSKPKDLVTSIYAKASAATKKEDSPRKDLVASMSAKMKAATQPVSQGEAKTKDSVTSTSVKASATTKKEDSSKKDLGTSMSAKAKAATEPLSQGEAKSKANAATKKEDSARKDLLTSAYAKANTAAKKDDAQKEATRAAEPQGDAKTKEQHQGSRFDGKSFAALRISGEYADGPDYWNARYSKKDRPYEWLIANPAYDDSDYLVLRKIVEEASMGYKMCKILHVGCGDSILPLKLYDDGYKNIANIDTSDVVISQMRQQSENRPSMTWEVMDALEVAYKDKSFDMVIDKSLLDTFACMKTAEDVVPSYFKEMMRLLRPGRSFICVSLSARGHLFDKAELAYTVTPPRFTHTVKK